MGHKFFSIFSREIYHVLVKSIVQLSKPFNGSRIALIQVQIQASPDTAISDLFFFFAAEMSFLLLQYHIGSTPSAGYHPSPASHDAAADGVIGHGGASRRASIH